jgi:Protein of unknown function (DUF3047)
VRRAAAVGLLAAGAALAQSSLAPVDGQGAKPAPPWREVLLPKQTLPRTRFTVVEMDGQRVLRIESAGSYGNLLHELVQPVGAAPVLSWRWRLDRAIDGAALQRKAGDDAALKVCVLMDAPLDGIPFLERQQLRLARLLSGEPLPAATLCYVWDPALAAGSVLPNAYTRRMRWWVLQGRSSPLGTWREERRELRADVLRAFGDELAELPRITAVLVGADADNTGGQGLGFVAGMALR